MKAIALVLLVVGCGGSVEPVPPEQDAGLAVDAADVAADANPPEAKTCGWTCEMVGLTAPAAQLVNDCTGDMVVCHAPLSACQNNCMICGDASACAQ